MENTEREGRDRKEQGTEKRKYREGKTEGKREEKRQETNPQKTQIFAEERQK